MPRGPKAAKLTKAKVEAKRPVARKSRKNEGSGARQLEKRLEEALKREAEAREQQTATSEILRVISSSPTDVQPVFDAMARSAVQLCSGVFSIVLRFDGELMHFVAHHNFSPGALTAYRQWFPRRAADDHLVGRAIIERRIMNVPDVTAEFRFVPGQREDGFHSVLFVPMLRDGVSVGVIGVSRAEIGAFPENQVELLRTFADQAVIAIENVRLFNETKEALEQQTATAEILRVISRSPTDVQPVFDAIVQSAATLCHVPDVIISMADRGALRLVASIGPVAASVRQSQILRDGGLPLTRGSVTGRAFVDRRTVHVDDVSAMADDDFPEGKALQREYGGHGTTLAVPLLRGAGALGVLTLVRNEISPFTERQVALLESFADQAVIAIENVRLFNETKEALEQQTATAEILRVISTSPTDLQPVLEAVGKSAVRFCGADDAELFRLDGEHLKVAAHHGPIPAPVGRLIPVVQGSVSGRAFAEQRAIHVADLQAEAEEFPVTSGMARELGFRTSLSVPLLREGMAVGTITLRRAEVNPFTDKQIALLQTFADQAVIAIENVRLFTELQASNRELTTALDQQTATSEILRVISQAQTDVQPVFDAIVGSAKRLLRAHGTALTRIIGDRIVLVAFTMGDEVSAATLQAGFPQDLHSDSSHARAIRARAPLNIVDAQTDARGTERSREIARTRGYRSQIVVPMLRHDEPIGTISAARGDVGAFSDDEIALLQTFADQAVIAIENVRLLTELQERTVELTRSVEQLTALGEVGQAVSSSLDVDTVLTTIVARAVQLSGADGGTLYEYDETAEVFELRATANVDDQVRQWQRTSQLRLGEGVVGIAGQTRASVEIPDITIEGAYDSRLRDALLRAGTRALLALPLLGEERLLGGLVMSRRAPGAFAPEVVSVLKAFATQSALAIQNARLFREIADKSRQLEAASQHKSEFLANMSHELRTPLNAIIGFSEVLTERMFGELNEKQDEYLRDIYASGQHLLSLINDILDLSKIEAGRMELEVADFDLPTTIDHALTLVRERAGRRGIALHQAVDARLGAIRADERKIKQILLNLLSNAIKFTPEGGRIEVQALPADGAVEVSVRDTGVGIAPEDQETVFEEFRQVGTAAKKVEGTGLGLALSRKFVELHGGRIWVSSAVGAGSTFTFRLPVSQ